MDFDKEVPQGTPLGTNVRDPTTSPPNYFRDPLVLGSGSGTKPIIPETSVEYLCVHGKDLRRSGEMSGYGKMSNVDRIRHGQANMLQVISLWGIIFNIFRK